MTATEPPVTGESSAAVQTLGERQPKWAILLSALVQRHRRLLLIGWVVLLGVCAASAFTLVDSLRSGGWDVAGSSTVIVRDQLSEGFQGRGETTAVLVVHDREHTDGDPEFDRRTSEVFDRVRADDRLQVESSFGWSTLSAAGRQTFLGRDRRTVVTSLGSALDDDAATKQLPSIQRDLVAQFDSAGLDVSLVNIQSFQGALNEDVVRSLIRAEVIALPLVVLVLLVLFRGVVAALVAMTTTVTGIVFALGILGPIAQQVELSIFIENIVLMFGMGVGVDYSLILIKRFKEELAAGHDVPTAVVRMLATAGHTVIASGITIIVAAAALFVVPLNAIVSLATGAALVVAVAVLVSMVLMPVLLHLLGHRINRGRVWIPAGFRGEESGGDPAHRWYRVAMLVMRRPVVFLTVSSFLLLLLAIPAASMKLSLPDDRILPASAPVRTGFENITEQFGPGAALPIQVIVDSPAPLRGAMIDAELSRLVADLGALPDVAVVNSGLTVLQLFSPAEPLAALESAVFDQLPAEAKAGVRYFISPDNRRFVVEVVPTHSATDSATVRLLDRVVDRTGELSAPLMARVGGATTRSEDVNKVISAKLPLVIGLMLAAVYLVLLLSFRSLFLPLKAIAMNVLSVGATFGALVLIFQDGWSPSWLGLDHSGYLVAFVPPLVLAMIVGLSTDYEVFLLSRVREEYRVSGDNRLSVARGMSRTAPLISGAAILMIVVFGAFGFAGNMVMQQLGIGLAIAVALDATVVRILVVPAAMRLMGRWNWWLPGRSGGARDSTPVASVQ